MIEELQMALLEVSALTYVTVTALYGRLLLVKLRYTRKIREGVEVAE